MTKMHSYSVSNQSFRLKILSLIALVTFITVLLIDSVKKGSFDFSSLKIYLSSASLVTITFTIIYWGYDRYIWKINRFDKVPDLSGTWLGMASNPYAESLRLELMHIKQHWSKIYITVHVYQGKNVDPKNAQNWLDALRTVESPRTVEAVRMGVEDSTIALITECEHNGGNLTFNYDHSPRAGGQVQFEGVMSLNYEIRRGCHELNGSYFNTKRGQHFNSEENFEGIIGRVVFRKASSKLIDVEEVLQEAKAKEDLIELHRELTSQIQ